MFKTVVHMYLVVIELASVRDMIALLKGPLHRLQLGKHEDIDPTENPLGQRISRLRVMSYDFLQQNGNVKRCKSFSRRSDDPDSRVLKLMRFRDLSMIDGDIPLGFMIGDWKEYGFELNTDSCELVYNKIDLQQSDHEINHARIKSIGFIQSHTRISRGTTIQTNDRHPETMEKLHLFTMVLCFQTNNSILPKYLVLGHRDEAERDRWLLTIELIIERKLELERGWQQFASTRIISDLEKAENWLRARKDDVGAQVNEKARRKARLSNGKVLNDLPRIFAAHSEACPLWPRRPPPSSEGGADADIDDEDSVPRVMHLSHVVPALAELGLELPPRLAERLVAELRSQPQCAETPDRLDRTRFAAVFHSCRRELLVSPTAAMRQALLRTMQTSGNPFLRLLSPAEHMLLIDGRDASGVNTCVCREYPRDAVLVRQGDAGDSMFLVLDGRLSVVVAFGEGAAAATREVAVLGEGSVMGEMSLVLGRSPHRPPSPRASSALRPSVCRENSAELSESALPASRRRAALPRPWCTS